MNYFSLLLTVLLRGAAWSIALTSLSRAAELEPMRMTQTGTADEQLLYFTSTSLLANDQGLVFISNRTGHPNLFYRDLRTGTERQLTTNTEGFLKSYVYFDGQPYRGFGKASVSLDPVRGIVYYIQGRQICCVNIQGEHRVLAEYPAGQMTAFTHPGCQQDPGHEGATWKWPLKRRTRT